MPFKPHIPTGTIWIVWGEDVNHLYKKEYKGKRTVRALKTDVTRTKKGGNYKKGDPDLFFAYVQYEGPDFPLSDIAVKDLYSMGVISQNITSKSAQRDLGVKSKDYWIPA